MPGASDNGREDGSGSVIPGEPSFTHARAVVNDQSGNIVVTHVIRFYEKHSGKNERLKLTVRHGNHANGPKGQPGVLRASLGV